ncbi:hypothetical protein HI914_01858 [Erysiphe necator]|nr:hypothetical protein HI914_01858 [Erysiphe necator]
MSLRSQSSSLDDSCTVVYNHTIYSYSSESFQSLKLEKNTEWNELPMGVPVKGGVCVHRTPENNDSPASMFIVGGVTDMDTYHGLQRFTFESQTWDTILLSDQVIQNRIYHGAVYLNASDSILVYSGIQDKQEGLSSQTFTIQASEPYRVTAYQSIAPPAKSPVMLPWSSNQAVYLGGSENNRKVMLFDPKTSWVDSGITLLNPVVNTENVKSTIISGDDLTKVLYTFDLSKSPNSVNMTVLRNADGSPIQNARQSFSQGTQNSPKSNKNLTAKNWPSYDATLAPRISRKVCTISYDLSSGLVVFAGGSEVDSISIFDARGNHWDDPLDLLGSKELNPPGNSASIAISDNLKGSQQVSETNSPLPAKYLAAIIVSILISAVLIISLLCFTRSQKAKAQNNKNNDPRFKGGPDEEDGMDFIDKGVSDEILEKYSSSSSGRSNQSKKDSDYNNSHHIYKDVISKPISLHKRQGEDSPTYLEGARPAPLPNENWNSERRSSGWNRYWSSENSSQVDEYYVSKSNNPYHHD